MQFTVLATTPLGAATSARDFTLHDGILLARNPHSENHDNDDACCLPPYMFFTEMFDFSKLAAGNVLTGEVRRHR
ncbi:hypothetical protein PG994_000107 [Apiospora phragmitis]|uniref:Uncharacterized protein n=1 Tax=Apiospora phragmitis TaxID=2905665 RepID=A0ABR1X5H6_9PEZI